MGNNELDRLSKIEQRLASIETMLTNLDRQMPYMVTRHEFDLLRNDVSRLTNGKFQIVIYFVCALSGVALHKLLSTM